MSLNILWGQNRIEISEYPRFISPEYVKEGEMYIDTCDQNIYNIFFFDRKGSCFFYKRTLDGQKYIVGNYCNSDSLYTGTKGSENPLTGELEQSQFIYYKPIKDKTWIYFDNSTKTLTELVYDKGKIIYSNIGDVP
ncbi:MAG TPA: hypothetical protein DDX39_05745 [Bacteroidales bacterium]|nr:MAG: hypothetical protein A2W98_07015 [Bacteroidetes bacterium GWF2_33_38]HBF88127.1 hypothetical protein [Bacteroidales bacterium]